MDQVAVFKALANESRLKILQWMKDPEKHFGDAPHGRARGRAVCVGEIQAKLGLSQSTVSHFLALLLQADLLVAKREGQWTFYERNENTIKALGRFLKEEI
ncbi:MAG: ArsR/SmtB family transcription factor [Acidiferrobacterales bacterium]